jgi:hypothetical protein
MPKVRYTGVVLTGVVNPTTGRTYQDELLDFTAQLLCDLDDGGHLASKGFVSRNAQGERLAHHMTCNLGEAKPEQRQYLGNEVTLLLDGWAFDEKALAVRVSHKPAEIHCSNETPHITLAINPDNGGKPFHSNDLKEWTLLDEPFAVVGVYQEV